MPSPAETLTAPGSSAPVAAPRRFPEAVDLGRVEPEQADEVGMGTEAAVADADPELGAEPGGDECVRDAVDDEGGHRELVGVGPEHPDAGKLGRPARSVAASERSCR